MQSSELTNHRSGIETKLTYMYNLIFYTDYSSIPNAHWQYNVNFPY